MSTTRKGSVTFAAIVILTVGALNAIWGIAALANKEYFHEASLLFESLQTWGWVYLIIGALQVFVAGLIFTERPWGYALGMFGAFLGILVNFLSVGAYPVWSVLLIALDFFVLFTKFHAIRVRIKQFEVFHLLVLVILLQEHDLERVVDIFQ